MSGCESCGGRAHDAFLCGRCQADLRQMLTDLPWWIDRLAEAAVGHAKLGDGGRHAGSGTRLKGDDEVLPKCTCGHPEHEHADECGMTIPGVVTVIELLEPNADGNTSREIRGPERICVCCEYVPSAKQAKMRAQFLAAGRVNSRASRLLDRIQNSLSTIVRDLCESRGLDLPPSVATGSRTGVAACTGMARWLSGQLSAISASEGAGQTFNEIHRFVGDDKRDGEIVRLINRPVPMRVLGKCPTWIEGKQAICGTELSCRQDVVEVYCRACRHTHNPDRLQLLLMKDLERKKITIKKILEVNRIQPEEYRIPESTLRDWRRDSKLKPRGYRRPDGREVITRHSADDVPLYLWADVQKLRMERPARKVKAG
jgi:hypothetical protein